jgi:WD40-like Beta Propeller Repeat
MPKSHSLLRAIFLWVAVFACGLTFAEKPQKLISKHYRIYFEKKHEAVAAEVLQVAERVWPLYAKAYDAYQDYQPIDIFLRDPGDFANGNAIYTFSRVEIYVPHINWVMRGRSNWIGNVVSHELAHVFTLRRAAKLSAFDDVLFQSYAFNRSVNWSLATYFIPLVAPTWYIEGIAQFEAEQMGYDIWDSQRDMIVRDAYLTGTLPSLAEIETFDGDWVQAERTYNTGFAFMRYLKERYGLEKVRKLAFPKPFFHFGGSVMATFGKPLDQLFHDWKRSLAETYAPFKEKVKDDLADMRITGSFNQNLAFSPDGKYMAWLGNGDRQYPINWIYWIDVEKGKQGQSASPVTPQAPGPGKASPHGNHHGHHHQTTHNRLTPQHRINPRDFQPWNRVDASPAPAMRKLAHAATERTDAPDPLSLARERSNEYGSAGLEFSPDGKKLLTTRGDRYSPYNDVWEYEFLSNKSEDKKWRRLTWNERASYPTYHPRDARQILFVQLFEGSSNIALLDSAGRVHRLTRFRDGQQCYNPRFTPKGDSIYFTLGLGEREALVAISAQAAAYDEFEALRDSSNFPDSLAMAKGEAITFLTPFEVAAFRDLRFHGDTLLFSSNRKSGVYEAYARLPQDSSIYRLTDARTQALEPQIHRGQLYYQGYEKQQFRLYRRPLDLHAAGPWPQPTDTLSLAKQKRKDLAKVFESDEPTVRRVAWGIEPVITLAPRFIDDTTLSSINLDLGLNVALGSITGGMSQGLEAFVSKRIDSHTPIEYGATYSGGLSFPGAWHTRFYWQPDLGYSLSHIQQARVVDFNETVAAATANLDSLWIENKVRYDVVYYSDMAFYSMGLPFSGHKAGPGTLYFGNYGRWYRRSMDLTLSQTYTETPFTMGTDGRIFEEPAFEASQTLPLYRNVQNHRHFLNALYGQWIVQSIGTPLPQAFVLYGAATKWWANYATTTELDVDAASAVLLSERGEALGLLIPVQADFNPWQLDFGMVGMLSKGENFMGMLSVDIGTFTQKFPQTRMPAHLVPRANTFDTTFVENPESNLWVMTYRLGLDRMPGYPYNFYYRGNDILEGQALFHSRLELGFPIKVRAPFGYPSPFSSLNQVQLSLIGNAGATFDRGPDKIYGILEKGEHHLLLDYGARASATFLMYHQIPMTAFAQVFMPYNQLQASKLYNLDYGRRTTIKASYTAEEARTDRADRNAYMNAVKEPRYFIGLSVGLF